MNAVTVNVREMKNYSRNKLNSLKDNWPMLLLAALFLCGLFCGSVMLKNNAYHSGEMAAAILKKLTDTQWLVRLKPMLIEVLAGLLLAFFAGFSAVGLPIILSLPCAKGMIYGVLAAELYTVYRVNGVIFSLLVLFPFLAAEIALLIVYLSDSMQLSSALFSAFRGAVGTGDRGAVKAYCGRFLLFSVISVLIVLLQSFLGGAVGSALLN